MAELFSEESGLVEWFLINSPLALRSSLAHAGTVHAEAWVNIGVFWLNPIAESSINECVVVTLWSIPRALSSASPWILDHSTFLIGSGISANECSSTEWMIWSQFFTC